MKIIITEHVGHGWIASTEDGHQIAEASTLENLQKELTSLNEDHEQEITLREINQKVLNLANVLIEKACSMKSLTQPEADFLIEVIRSIG